LARRHQSLRSPLLAHFNSFSATTKFTVERERKIRFYTFLGVNVTRKNGKVTTEVYRKPTDTGLYLHYDSNHTRSGKNGIINTLLHRAHSHCTINTQLNAEIKKSLMREIMAYLSSRVSLWLVLFTSFSHLSTIVLANHHYYKYYEYHVYEVRPSAGELIALHKAYSINSKLYFFSECMKMVTPGNHRVRQRTTLVGRRRKRGQRRISMLSWDNIAPSWMSRQTLWVFTKSQKVFESTAKSFPIFACFKNKYALPLVACNSIINYPRCLSHCCLVDTYLINSEFLDFKLGLI
jgi:hypothetical protein